MIAIDKYKKQLLTQVVVIFLICLLVILERVFYQIIIDAEAVTLSNLQINTDMTKSKGENIIPDAISNSFLQIFGTFTKFSYKFLFMTHIFITLYVSFDAFKTVKLTYVTLGFIYVTALLQMLYAGERPFWKTNTILTSACLSTYNHPSNGAILMLFIPFYGYYCWKKKTDSISFRGKNSVHLALGISVFIFAGIVQFLNYFIGIIYILNIVMSVAIAILYFTIAYTGDSIIDNVIQKTTIMYTSAKKHIFYWLLLICFLSSIVLIIYSGGN